MMVVKPETYQALLSLDDIRDWIRLVVEEDGCDSGGHVRSRNRLEFVV